MDQDIEALLYCHISDVSRTCEERALEEERLHDKQQQSGRAVLTTDLSIGHVTYCTTEQMYRNAMNACARMIESV